MKNSNKTQVTTLDDTTLNGMSTLFQGFNVLTSEYPAIINSASQGIALVDAKDPDNTQSETYLGTTYEIPVGVSFQSPTLIDTASTVSGAGESDYSSQMAASVGVKGSYGMFSASVEASYGSSVSMESSYYYATCIETGETYTLGFSEGDVDLDGSNSSLNFEVAAALQQAFTDLETDDDGTNAQNFFNEWGTHIISGIVMGGQTSYSMYGSTSDFSTSQDFSSSAEASYCTVSGSASFSESSSSSTEDVESQASMSIVGGDSTANANLMAAVGTDDASDYYTAWFESIPGNEAWYGFTDTGGLFLISDLCTIADTQAYLEDVFNQLTGVDVVIPSSNVNDQSTMLYSDSPGATSDDYLVDITDQSESGTTQIWEANSNEVLVGIGGIIDSDHHLYKMVVITLNMENQEYNNYFFGDGDSSTSWQAFGMAPEGSVITGFGLTQQSKSLSDLILFTQEVQLTDQNGTYLDATINEILSEKSDDQEIDFDNLPFGEVFASQGGGSTIQDFNRSATLNFPPDSGNTLVISGFSANSTNNDTPNDGFDYLTTNFTKLVLQSNSAVSTEVKKVK